MGGRVETASDGRKVTVAECTEPCAIERGMRVLGGKWTGSVLWHLKDEPVRFNDLCRMIGGASKKMISDRLRHLEAHGLVSRTVLDMSPVAVEYFITAHGRTALDFLGALKDWSEAEVVGPESSVVSSRARGS